MSWLLQLYPKPWQQRYRSEIKAYLADEPRTLRRDLDLIAGALDARLNPDFTPEPALNKGDTTMTSFFHCASRDITRTDGFKSATSILGVTFVLTAIGVTLEKTLGDHVAIQAPIFAPRSITQRSPFQYCWSFLRNPLHCVNIFYRCTALHGARLWCRCCAHNLHLHHSRA